MPMTIVVTRDVPDRYRGFLASIMPEAGPGVYEGMLDSSASGAYVMNFRYLTPGENGQTREGNIQAAVTRPYGCAVKYGNN